MSKRFGVSVKEKPFTFNRKKPPVKPGLGRGGHLPSPVGVRVGRQDD